MKRWLADLQHPDPDVRWRAASDASEGSPAQRVGPLCSALQDSDARVRRHAAAALGKLADPTTVSALVTALERDESAAVRMEAAGALGRIGDPAALPVLHRALEDADVWVCSRACEALGRLASPHSYEPLVRALERPERWVQGRAARALSRLGEGAAVAPLLRLLARPECHSWVAEALGALGDPRAVPALAGALASADLALRIQSARALGQLASPQGISALTSALHDPDSGVRTEAARALRNTARCCGGPDLLPAARRLAQLLNRWSAEGEEARAAYQEALQALSAAVGSSAQMPIPASPPQASATWPTPSIAPPPAAVSTLPVPRSQPAVLSRPLVFTPLARWAARLRRAFRGE